MGGKAKYAIRGYTVGGSEKMDKERKKKGLGGGACTE